MSLRLLEAHLPEDAADGVEDLLSDVATLEIHSYAAGAGERLIRVLLDAHEVEAASDHLVRAHGTRDGFRLTLMRVEATLPEVKEPQIESTPEPARKSRSRRVSREELTQDISQASRVDRTYVVMVALSTIVAAVGLMRDDVAVVIGAMVIAPLLGPNVALSLAAALGDRQLARRSLKAIGVGLVIASVLSMALGYFVPFDAGLPAITGRTQPQMGDIMLALAAGAAGALAFTAGVSAVVVGVMVAVALLPPLAVAGMLIGAGKPGAVGALTLCLTNVTCINLSAMATFYLQDVRPRTWWEAGRARRATVRAALAWAALLVLLAVLIFVRQSQ